MKDVQYEVTVALEVEKVAEIDNTDNIDDSEIGVEIDTEVVRASCACQSGAGGGCHHVCQLLQLTRLLQLTENELDTWNPKSPTSVACKWVLSHCGAGRDKDHNIFHRKPMQTIAQDLRTLRDPKKHPFRGSVHEAGSVDEPVESRRVVAMDRGEAYSPHPDFDVWAESKIIFDQGGPHSRIEHGHLMTFVDGQRRLIERFDPDGIPLPPYLSEACIDVLPPDVRSVP